MTLLLMTASHLEGAALSRRLPGHPRLLVIGVGPVAAALGVAAALAEDELPTACVLLGLAGTRDVERLPVGSALLADGVVDESVGAGRGPDFVPLERMGLSAKDRLPEHQPLVTTPPGLVTDPPWIVGAAGTVAAASGDEAHAHERRSRHPEVLAEEMEGYAVALACRRAGAPLAMIRGVSNVAGDRDHARWEIEAAFDATARAAATWLDAMRPR